MVLVRYYNGKFIQTLVSKKKRPNDIHRKTQVIFGGCNDLFYLNTLFESMRRGKGECF